MSFISHPQIAPDSVEERTYQVTMAEGCVRHSTLLILPTGMGKTIVALLVTANLLETGRKVLIMAPTKPLVDQHADNFSKLLCKASVGTMNGNMAPDKRAEIVRSNDVIISTPQVISNDLASERYGINDFGLVIYDEAHRGVGNYSYVDVARDYRGRSMGMTASPGSDIKKIEEVCDNLGLNRIDIRSEDDPDVSPYVHDIYVKKVEVSLPKEMEDMLLLLNLILDRYVKELRNLRLMNKDWPPSTKHMLMIGGILQSRLARGERTNTVFRGMTVQAVCMKLLHAIGLLESQGMTPLRSYLKSIDVNSQKTDGGKADRELVRLDEFKALWKMVAETKVEHPKLSRVMSLVSKELTQKENPRILVFSHFREAGDMLVEKLSTIDGAKVGKLIGQSKGGLSQKDQIELLDEFRKGNYNVVVSTSVGEEGLDIASTDMVIFYEPVSSEIRTIQRRGRTGRKNDGEVYVLVTKDTRDEAIENSSRQKERKMRSSLEKLNRELEFRNPSQRSMDEFPTVLHKSNVRN